MIHEFLDSACFAVPAIFSGWVVSKLWRKRPPPEASCAGYGSKCTDGSFRQFTDCRALRSVMCLDGRCNFHCKQLCKCGDA